MTAHPTPAPTPDGAPPLRLVSARRGVPARLGRIWTYRDLLRGLVAKEIKVRYKNSFLGLAWSMLNPALYLVVFYVVFEVVLDSGLPDFVVYLLSGLLVWNLFATALQDSVRSVVANGGIVKKVDFPREVLPLAAVGTALVNFFLQSAVLVVVLAVTRYPVAWGYVPLVVPALVALVLLVAGLGVALAALNVYVRDVQHLVELGVLAWFWFTPVVWYWGLVADTGESRAQWLLVNPVTSITLTFQRAIYGTTEFRDAGGLHTILPDWSVGQHLLAVGVVGVVGVVLLLVGEVVFGRLEGNFAEEL